MRAQKLFLGTQPPNLSKYTFTSGEKFWSAIDIFAERNLSDFKSKVMKVLFCLDKEMVSDKQRKIRNFFFPANEV